MESRKRRPRTKGRIRGLFGRTVVVALATCSAGSLGCRHAASSAGPQTKRHAHEIPAHKPDSFPTAVRRLATLNRQIGNELGVTHRATGRSGESLRIALDIAQWVPELAADSEMPEALWSRTSAHTATLVEEYQRLLSGPCKNPPAAVKRAGATIEKLEAVLAISDPNWFVVTGSGGRDAKNLPSAVNSDE